MGLCERHKKNQRLSTQGNCDLCNEDWRTKTAVANERAACARLVRELKARWEAGGTLAIAALNACETIALAIEERK